MFLYKPKQNKQIIIKNSAIQNLNESLTDVVYHFTSLLSCYKIVSSNTILLQSSFANDSDNFNTKQLYYLSTTREKNSNFGYSQRFSKSGARITLNGRKLSQRYKAKPIDYWGASMGKQKYYKGNYSFKEKQQHSNGESEDRIFSYENSIRNAFDYIERIDILINAQNENHLFLVYKILLSGFGDKIFVYNNPDDFNKQSTNTINNEINSNKDNYKYLDIKPDYDYTNSNTYVSLLSNILLIIFSGEINQKDDIKESVKLIKKYNLDKFIGKKLFYLLNRGYYSYIDLISDTKDKIHNVSNKPTEDGHQIIKILSDYMKEHKIRNYYDLIKYKIQFGVIPESYVDRLIDTDKTIKFLTYKNSSFTEIIIPNPEKTSLWDIIENKEYFVNNLYNFGFDKHHSKDDESFYRYLQKITNKNISVVDAINIVNKLNLSEEEKRDLFEYGTFQYEDLGVYEAIRYRLPEYSHVAYFYRTKEYIINQNKIKQMFLKK